MNGNYAAKNGHSAYGMVMDIELHSVVDVNPD